jgi:hypothetical protein
MHQFGYTPRRGSKTTLYVHTILCASLEAKHKNVSISDEIPILCAVVFQTYDQAISVTDPVRGLVNVTPMVAHKQYLFLFNSQWVDSLAIETGILPWGDR